MQISNVAIGPEDWNWLQEPNRNWSSTTGGNWEVPQNAIVCLQLPAVSAPSALLAASPSVTHASDSFPPLRGNGTSDVCVGRMYVGEGKRAGLGCRRTWKRIAQIYVVSLHTSSPNALKA